MSERIYSSDRIRQAFIEYFVARSHTHVPSSSLVPQDDPTLLFTNAGMVQFKDVFLGQTTRSYRRAVTAQKCVRAGGKHNDLDQVGRTARHHTFFEMLGNFSFGDYFKREAIGFAWEFVTGVLRIPAERLWVTVYQDDDEAFALWRELANIPAERIVRLGAKDNFWMMGEIGPCGPCSEILFDRGEEFSCGPRCGLGLCDCDRFLEFWNLVFMQYSRDDQSNLTPLPRPSIDTGMGLERVASILQGVNTNYETDLLRPIITTIEELSGQVYYPDQRGFPFRVIADHARAMTFLIADGVLPSNEGRGYVLRRIIRRAVRLSKALELPAPFFARICETVIQRMREAYPELERSRDFITKAVTIEETKFEQTLTAGLAMLDKIIEELRQRSETVIPGLEVFRLYDTFGFPKELTEEIGAEQGLTVDWAGYETAMTQQRMMARATRSFAAEEQQALQTYQELSIPSVAFVGYDRLRADSVVVALLVEGRTVDSAGAGQQVDVVTVETPFYPESGGQVGDTGTIMSTTGCVKVENTTRPLPDLIVHHGVVEDGFVSVGGQVDLQVDVERRRDIMPNHTATHLLHAALRQVLGEHARQAGSLVAPDRLRFDFAHLTSLSPEELERVERIVNREILSNHPVKTVVMGYREALERGVVALFGEKYGDTVRVVTVGGLDGLEPRAASGEPPPISAELCGGTHVRATGDIGSFYIVDESSIGAGLRRIEAVTGRGATEYARARMQALDRVARQLQAPAEEVSTRIASLQAELESRRKEIIQLYRELAALEVDQAVAAVKQINGINVLAARVKVPSRDLLREIGDRIRDRLGSGVIVLGAVVEERPSFLAIVTPDLVARGLRAGQIMNTVALVAGGGGGGRPEMAQAGGKDPSKLDEALATVVPLVEAEILKGWGAGDRDSATPITGDDQPGRKKRRT
ncbi:MAG: alanine--tRNA ligase [Chloroflexota bacterium]|nr:MAG: alanine--tRNA ligase [Chloroflexota bacterium]